MNTLIAFCKLVPRSLYLALALYALVSVIPALTFFVDNQNDHPAEIEAHTTETSTSVTLRPKTDFDAITIATPQVLGVRTTPEFEVLGTIRLIGPPLDIEPINRNGSIVIPSIDVNSPIEFDVSVSDKSEYNKALESGVAHAAGTGKPNLELGNTYLFAHSTSDERDIALYAAVFTKLQDLELGAKIIVFYEGKRYDYEMVQDEIVPSFDTTVLTRQHEYSALTLQTCHPPGIAQDRFITTAKLIGVYDE